MNLWVLTEERPKIEVLQTILKKFTTDRKIGFFSSNLLIIPILKDSKFIFTYELIGFRCCKIDKIFIKIVSGSSSFVDFLIFYQDEEPTYKDIPIYAIEETKTNDSESRNTGIYQRCSKFVYINHFYPNIKKIMLYNLKVPQKENPTQTNIFGSRMLLTMGVEIIGKDIDYNLFKPFNSIQELIKFKNEMRKPPKGNIPIDIKEYNDKITISGRLFKSNSLAHDPNIGAISIISDVLRKLSYKKNIILINHGLKQKHLTSKNKFIIIANKLNLKFEGLIRPTSDYPDKYWHYDIDGEKIGTIFLHIVVENFTNGYSIFENHAGAEKSYFITSDGKYISLAKYNDRSKYKAGDKNQIIFIPDLVLIDCDRSEIINCEGKKWKFRYDGIQELNNYDSIEQNYIKKYYSNFNILRTVILYGGTEEESPKEIEIGFLLNEKGFLILGIKAPELFQDAIKNLLDFWGCLNNA